MTGRSSARSAAEVDAEVDALFSEAALVAGAWSNSWLEARGFRRARSDLWARGAILVEEGGAPVAPGARYGALKNRTGGLHPGRGTAYRGPVVWAIEARAQAWWLGMNRDVLYRFTPDLGWRADLLAGWRAD